MRINIYVILLIASVILLTNIMRIWKILKNKKNKVNSQNKDNKAVNISSEDCCNIDISKLDLVKINKYDNIKYFDISYYPELKNINNYNQDIYKELHTELENDLNDWLDYPENNNKYNSDIKVLPFLIYGKYNKINTRKMPQLTKFIKEIKNIKMAYISVISPHTLIKENTGWGYHSNRVLRCQYALHSATNCIVSIKNDDDFIGKIIQIEAHEWIIYNNSKKHYVANNSDKHLVLLTLDIKRPKDIENDDDYGDPDDLLEIIDYYNKK